MKVPENSLKCEFLNIDIYIQKNIYKKMNRKDNLVRFFRYKIEQSVKAKNKCNEKHQFPIGSLPYLCYN